MRRQLHTIDQHAGFEYRQLQDESSESEQQRDWRESVSGRLAEPSMEDGQDKGHHGPHVAHRVEGNQGDEGSQRIPKRQGQHRRANPHARS